MRDINKYLQYSPSEIRKEGNDNKKFHLINKLNSKNIITFILIILLYF